MSGNVGRSRVRRVLLLAGLVFAALPAASALAGGTVTAEAPPVGLTGLSGDPAPFSTAKAAATPLLTRAQILGVLAGIPQTGSRLGRANAPVTVTLYGDLECPICRDFVLGTSFTRLVADDVRSGKVKVVYHAFRTASHTFSVFVAQQAAALAAGEEARFWQFAMFFLQHQGAEGTNYVTEAYLDNIARQVPGLYFNIWKQARGRAGLSAQVRADERAAIRRRVTATPTVIIGGPHGTTPPLHPPPNYPALERRIKALS